MLSGGLFPLQPQDTAFAAGIAAELAGSSPHFATAWTCWTSLYPRTSSPRADSDPRGDRTQPR